MKIAIDARELRGKPTGVGRYLSELLAAWKALPAASAHELILLTPDAHGGGTAWEQLTLPGLVRRVGADVLFAPAYTGPLGSPAPMVVAIHDVSFVAHPEWFSWREGLRRRVLTRWSARRAARVLTISEFSKREIVRHLGIDASKIAVTYPGVTSMTDTDVARGLTDREPDRKGPPHAHQDLVILYVGSVFSRRHVPELIEGFARLARRHPRARLEIVGDNRTTPRIDLDAFVQSSGAADRIQVRSYVGDRELRGLYRGARAFAFLSGYEGFGLTPVEALSAGMPIVVLDTPIAREIYGPAAIYVLRPDPEAIEAALERALMDTAERARLVNASAGVLARYSWDECARRTLQILLACGR